MTCPNQSRTIQHFSSVCHECFNNHAKLCSWPCKRNFIRVFRIFEFSRRNGIRRPIPSSPGRPAGRASLSLFPVLLLLLPQSESAIAGARSRAGKVRNIFSAFSPSGAIKRPETPMQQPPTEIRDRLLTGLDQDYNVSSVCPARYP